MTPKNLFILIALIDSVGQRYKKSAKLKKFRGLFLSIAFFTLLFIALKDRADGLLREFLGKETDEPNHWETTHHGDGTAVDRIDGIADKHVHHRESHTPDEAQTKQAQTEAVVTPRQ